MRIRRAAVEAHAAIARESDRDCCVFARNVLRHAYGPEVIDAVPLARWHLIVEDGAGPWEPVHAAHDARIAEAVYGHRAGPFEPEPGRWHLAQGWRGTPLARGVTGHTWLWWGVTAEVGELLDSTRSRGPRLLGMQHWREIAAPFVGGLAVAVLRPLS